MRLAALALISLLLPGACARPPEPLEHEAYIWQRRWHPGLIEALNASAPRVNGWRILVAEVDAEGKAFRPAADFVAIAAVGRPVVAVLRIQPQVQAGNEAALVAEALAVARAWKQSPITLAGIEIDHDASLRGLPDYLHFLRTLRAALDPDLRLSATLLPAWLEAPEVLADITAAVDETVLQLHAVRADGPLFDAESAHGQIAAFARLTRHPFRIALPIYGSRVAITPHGRIGGVESESPGSVPDALELRERYAAPAAVASFLARIERQRPAKLRGIIWFRLPTAGDKRSWSRSTWHAVMAGQALAVHLTAELRAGPKPGWQQVVLRNVGTIDAEMPTELRIDAACRTASGASPHSFYVAEALPATTLWLRSQRALLRAGEELTVGSVRCAAPAARVDFHP